MGEILENEKLFLKRKKWDQRFLKLAKFISEWSKDPSTKVGAVIVDDKNIILGLGYNGFPRGVPDREDDYLDKKVKYELIVHAEMNAILNSSKNLYNCNATIYIWPLFPCNECAKAISQSGIKRVVSVKNDKNQKWNMETSKYIFDSNNIEYVLYSPEFIDDNL
ncbi:MAG: dCMP deaminase family protein [Candidatus Aenigmatarchaeota archaeon]